MSIERRVGPLVRLGGDDVRVGIEEDGREVGVGTRPLEDDDWFGLDEFKGVGFKREGLGLG